jgi:hypothetical protein
MNGSPEAPSLINAKKLAVTYANPPSIASVLSLRLLLGVLDGKVSPHRERAALVVAVRERRLVYGDFTLREWSAATRDRVRIATRHEAFSQTLLIVSGLGRLHVH